MGISYLDQSVRSRAIDLTHPSMRSPLGYVKRAIDLVSAVIGGVAIAPLVLLLMALVKLDSSGPVLYKQRRVGYNGEEFWMYKFRTMHVGAEARQAELMALNEMTGPLFKIKDDPRVTRVGRWLRRTSLDELPQLLNVVRGEMSLVGPRPPMLSEVEQFEPWHLEKLSVRPGMTGLWQVNGRNTLPTFDQMIELDMRYIRTWSFSLDFLILLKTVWVVTMGLGAH